jgi:hypothetical protein
MEAAMAAETRLSHKRLAERKAGLNAALQRLQV